jgi:CRISPR-associated protein Csd1
MILQQLCADAERILGPKIAPPMYAWRPVRWIIDLDREGRLVNITATTGEGRRADRGRELLVPICPPRASGIRATLLADTAAYVLGHAPDDRRVGAKHEAFRKLAGQCSDETQNATVRAVLRFLDTWDAGRISDPRFAEVAPADTVSFRVDSMYPVDDPDVREFWARCFGRDAAAERESASECLVCGRRATIAENLPVNIKGIPGGQSSGTALVSINCTAFESLGLSRARTSGVCAECGERFGKALNHLLANERSSLRVGPVVYVFWTRQEVGFSPRDFLDRPDPQRIKDLVAAYRTGDERYLRAGSDTDFYASALSASGGRAVVRDWLHTTVGNARRNLARWFDLLDEVDEWGQPGAPLGVFRLAVSLHRRADDIEPQLPRVLVHVALHGGALPSWVLAQALKRCRADQDVTYPRAGLIKAVLASQSEGMEVQSMTQVVPAETRPACLCGRLLAVLEEVQRQAALPGKVGATIVDRFFGSACTAPASVFGNLLSQAQHHLGKLRKTRPGAHYALQRRLEEVLAPLAGFPATLSLKEQALFSLGYYHERAVNRAAAMEHTARHDATADDQSDAKEED